MQLTVPKATLRLQFPVPDLRPWPERRSWAEKAVRKESLRLDLAGAEFQMELGPAGATRLEASFSDLHGKEALSAAHCRLLSRVGFPKKGDLPP